VDDGHASYGFARQSWRFAFSLRCSASERTPQERAPHEPRRPEQTQAPLPRMCLLAQALTVRLPERLRRQTSRKRAASRGVGPRGLGGTATLGLPAEAVPPVAAVPQGLRPGAPLPPAISAAGGTPGAARGSPTTTPRVRRHGDSRHPDVRLPPGLGPGAPRTRPGPARTARLAPALPPQMNLCTGRFAPQRSIASSSAKASARSMLPPSVASTLRLRRRLCASFSRVVPASIVSP
jgi:hypothetical protein